MMASVKVIPRTVRLSGICLLPVLLLLFTAPGSGAFYAGNT